MTVEQFEKFIQKSQFEMAVQLMSKEEFLRWVEKHYDKFHNPMSFLPSGLSL